MAAALVGAGLIVMFMNPVGKPAKASAFPIIAKPGNG
jgi:hypothetical protein